MFPSGCLFPPTLAGLSALFLSTAAKPKLPRDCTALPYRPETVFPPARIEGITNGCPRTGLTIKNQPKTGASGPDGGGNARACVAARSQRPVAPPSLDTALARRLGIIRNGSPSG